MDPLSTVLLAICAILLCIVIWLFFNKKGQSVDTSEEEISQLQVLLKEKDNAISSLKTEQKDLSEKTESLIAQLKDKSVKERAASAKRISELESEIAKALEGGADDVVKNKIAEVDNLKKRIKDLEADLEEAKDEAESSKNETKQLQTENSSLHEELENEIRKGKRLLEEINDIKTRLDQVEKNFKKRIKDLEADLEEAKDEAESSKNETKQLQTENSSLHEELENEIRKGKRLLEEISDIKTRLDQVEKNFKKRIKDLEADLEEAKDEAESKEKKIKQLQSENSSLQEDLENEIRKGKKLIDEINDVKTRLTQVEKDFAIREEALDFVKEILTAERTSDESVRNLYQTVDGIVDYIRGEVRDSLISIYTILTDQQQAIFGTDLLAWAISKKKSWIQGKTSIAFVGEFSAGKTSIVNRILSQDDPNVPRLPVSTKATTAIPTYISGGVSTYYQFVTPGNELKGISEDTFKRVNKEVLDQVKGVSSLIQYFVMTYKNPNLDRLSILDTPGFNSNDSEDAERTIGVINECDALFWVFDVNAGTVNRSSIKIIKENLTKPLYVVINQIDTKSKSDVDSVENLIRKTLQDEGIKIESIIRFSKKEPLQNIMSPILAIQHDRSREQYLDELLNILSLKVKELANDTKDALKKSNQIENKHKRLVDSFIKAINSLSDDCVAVAEIPQYNSRWFSEDDYRISQSQYSEFISLLERISETHTAEIVNQYDDQIEAVGELQSSWAEHSQAKYNQKRLEECLETLQKKAKSLSNGVTTNYKPQSSLKTTSQDNTNKSSTSARSQGRGQQTNTTSASSVKEFISFFKWCIIEKKGDNVRIDWNLLLEQMRNVSNKNISGNSMRKNFPLFGSNDWVSIKELSLAVMNYINK